ncbi:MAG TPA: hypothetical protein VMF29_08585 [Candidatus Edwardsbacteria bacterium]|nr:hypothetical protein [Candidatus Edwardsbacteria bacterium]
MPATSEKKRAWVVSVDMGYGHQRAAYPLNEIANERVITANNDQMVSDRERRIWYWTRIGYETVSRLKSIPGIGPFIFGAYDRLQSIAPFYPFKVDARPNMTVMQTKHMITKLGLCRGLIEYVRKERLPFIATHFIPALAADYLGLDNAYCVVTDTDINRVWAIDRPQQTRLTYLTPSRHATMRLAQYGVPESRIVFTGFPLPREDTGTRDREVLKRDLAERLAVLDPNHKFIDAYDEVIRKYLGASCAACKRPLTLSFMIGGAGAQLDIGITIAKSLQKKIEQGKIVLHLVAGTRLDVAAYFKQELKALGLDPDAAGSGVRIIYALDKRAYFQQLNRELHHTDILWTKPSEMSFYTALGFPIIIAPPVGAHERFNMEWLEHIGSGFVQEDPRYVDQWLFYVLESGKYAEAAWHGFMNAPSLGTYNIEDALFGKETTAG